MTNSDERNSRPRPGTQEPDPDAPKADPNLALWLDFAKAVSISGIAACLIAILPAWINSQNKSAELAIEKAKTEAAIQNGIITQERIYVQAFLDKATDLDVEKRYLFTQYAAALARDDVLKTGWKQLHDAAIAERAKKRGTLDTKEKQVLTAVGAEKAKLEEEIFRLKADLGQQFKRVPALPASIKLSEALKHPCPTDTEAILSAYEPSVPFNVTQMFSGATVFEGFDAVVPDINSLQKISSRPGRITFVRRCVDKEGQTVGAPVVVRASAIPKI